MHDFLTRLGIQETNSGVYADRWLEGKGDVITSYSPIDGKPIAKGRLATPDEYEACVQVGLETFQRWRLVPAPERGPPSPPAGSPRGPPTPPSPSAGSPREARGNITQIGRITWSTRVSTTTR